MICFGVNGRPNPSQIGKLSNTRTTTNSVDCIGPVALSEFVAEDVQGPGEDRVVLELQRRPERIAKHLEDRL